MTEAEFTRLISWIALGFSGVSALAAIASAAYSRKQAHQATLSNKRPGLVIDPEFRPEADKDVWSYWEARVANPSEGTARITAARVRRGAALHEYAQDATDDYGNSLSSTPSGDRRKVPLDIRISAKGTRRPQALGGADLSIQWVRLYVKGVAHPRDVTLDWEWLDGTRR